MTSRRAAFAWWLLTLLLGASAVLSRPAVAAPGAGRLVDVSAPTARRGATRLPALSADRPALPPARSWHRGASRRQQREALALLLPANASGSISASEPLYGQRGAWVTRVVTPAHVAGRLAPPPRAPPAQN